MRTARHPAQTCTWPSNCVHSLLQVSISFREPITLFILPEPLRGSLAYMASGLSEDTVLESMCLPGSGRPSGRWFCYTFGRRAALHVTCCDSQRTGCSPWSVTWRARAGRRQEAHPLPLSTKDRFGNGSPHRAEFSGSIPQDLQNSQPPETKLAFKNVLLTALPKSLVFHQACMDLVITERLESTKSRQTNSP